MQMMHWSEQSLTQLGLPIATHIPLLCQMLTIVETAKKNQKRIKVNDPRARPGAPQCHMLLGLRMIIEISVCDFSICL